MDLSFICFFFRRCKRSRDQQVVDFKKVDAHVHQLKGSSARFLPQMAAASEAGVFPGEEQAGNSVQGMVKQVFV
ncbi:hypothetical protein BHE74_00031933 [Ensete ventricosum]|nr:hypothetical protein GW17_00031799 [Ensete ventricosum]RWW61020.1 hypothetical protein BHE74_00031933 [Ensete ventricosum]RZS03726.1 hypothetical protein BHM03_00033963 [Ensete ventricosum]